MKASGRNKTHYDLALSPDFSLPRSLSSICGVSLNPKRGSRDPLILYSNRDLPLFVLAMIITLTIAMTTTLRCLQEKKPG